MSFDLFTLDVATACPEESAAWQSALNDLRRLQMLFLDGESGLEESTVLAAKIKADELEQVARSAHAKWLARNG